MSAVMVDTPGPRKDGDGPPERRLDFWTAGLEEFVYHLKHPETLFNVPSERLASNRYPAVGEATTRELRRYFRRYRRRCMDAYAALRYAGSAMQRLGVQICRGPLEVRIWYDDCDDCYVDVIVSVDAPPERATRARGRTEPRDAPIHRRVPVHYLRIDRRARAGRVPWPAGDDAVRRYRG